MDLDRSRDAAARNAARPSRPPANPSVGGRIRDFRRAAGLTLRELAARSGVSIATISKLENGRIAGGFDTVYRIARGLGVLVTDLIAQPGDAPPVVVRRHDPRDVHATRLCHYRPQAFRSPGALAAYVIDVHARTVPEKRDWSIHPGEEVILVLSGSIELHVEGETPLRLGPGDSACFDCGRRHAFVSVGDAPARIVSVSTRTPGEPGGLPRRVARDSIFKFENPPDGD